jgi:hypothetical protein
MVAAGAAVYRTGPHQKPGEIAMTIAGLAAALRGMPRDARLLIDTPEGLKDLRCTGACPRHAGRRDGSQHRRRVCDRALSGGAAAMSGTSMSDEAFTDELDELIQAGRDGGLSDEDMIVLLDRATKALREGLT